MIQDVYDVEGMTCEHCVRAITSEVSALPGVEQVSVDLPKGEVTVTSQARLEYEQMAAAVDEAGYELVGREDK